MPTAPTSRTSRSGRSPMRRYNPIAYKPGGFVHGAGHGSTFQDRYGNWWNTGTPWIGYNWTFERRIDMLPGKFDADGQMAFSIALRRFPAICADRRRSTTPTACSPAGCCCRTASRRPPRRRWATSPPTGDRRKSADLLGRRENRPGETLTVDLGAIDTVRAVQVNFADYKSGRFADAPDIYTEFALQASRDGAALAGNRAHRAAAPRPAERLFRARRSRCARASSATSTATSARPTSRSATSACSAMPSGRAPACPADVSASRHADQRDATIRWAKVPGAVGYNIRFGIRPTG